MRAHPPGEDDDGTADPWAVQVDALGTFIRTQRQLARLSLREMASLTSVSNAYLSQIERGLHQPSLKVLRSIADALELTTEQILEQAGWAGKAKTRVDGRDEDAGPVDPDTSAPGPDNGTEEAIRRDPRLSDAQRDALLGVYRSFVDHSPD
ncbi:MAG TPA: helix-turn-helix domain-containing protein [Pseudonocardia sp.]|jgi:transcriptional regulator with XRE-family HTH domain|nr:helix-turn-helix domain-containing protein [Pseudonocardia sp.]